MLPARVSPGFGGVGASIAGGGVFCAGAAVACGDMAPAAKPQAPVQRLIQVRTRAAESNLMLGRARGFLMGSFILRFTADTPWPSLFSTPTGESRAPSSNPNISSLDAVRFTCVHFWQNLNLSCPSVWTPTGLRA